MKLRINFHFQNFICEKFFSKVHKSSHRFFLRYDTRSILTLTVRIRKQLPLFHHCAIVFLVFVLDLDGFIHIHSKRLADAQTINHDDRIQTLKQCSESVMNDVTFLFCVSNTDLEHSETKMYFNKDRRIHHQH